MTFAKKTLPLALMAGLAAAALVGCPANFASLEVHNFTGVPVDSVQMVQSPSGQNCAWLVPDQLPAGYDIDNGACYRVTNVPPGRYDLRATFTTPPCGVGGAVEVFHYNADIIGALRWVLATTGESGSCQITETLTNK